MRARRTDKPSPHASPTARLRQVAKLITNANRFGGSPKAKSRQPKGAKPAKSPPGSPSGISSTITDDLLPLFVESRLDGTPPLSDLEKELLLDTCKKVNPPPGWSLGAWKSLWNTSAADSLRLLQLHAGDDVYDIGDECDDGMYLCLAGGCTMTMVAPPSASSSSSSDRLVETQIEAAWAFGASELAVHAQRRATVTALVDSTFLSIDRDAYMGLVARNCFRVNTRSLGEVTRILARPRSNRGPSEIESLATSLRNLDFFRRMEHDVLVALCERALLVHVEERGGSLIMSPGDMSE